MNKFNLATFALIIILIIMIPLFVSSSEKKVEFNQFEIQGYKNVGFLSSYFYGLHLIFSNQKETANLEEPKEMFEFIYSWLPSKAIVFPTESVYYFATELEGKKIHGNFRFSEIEKKKIIFSYFYLEKDERKSFMLELKEGDELSIEKISENKYAVKFKDKKIRFILPEKEQKLPENFGLYRGDKFMGNVFDESGIEFIFIYNNETNEFYYILNSEIKDLEKLGTDYLISDRESFVFYKDEHSRRLVLSGVLKNNVEANNYFDGPADQIPYWIKLKEELIKVYPDSNLEAEINDFGYYINNTNRTRVIIVSYNFYNKPEVSF